MDFLSKNFNETNIEYYESGTESDIQVVFVPGVLNPGTWKHQIGYFSKKFRTISYRKEDKTYRAEKRIVSEILEQDSVENSVLVSANLGNSVIQQFEDHENVIATAYTGLNEDYGFKLPKNIYWLASRLLEKPKLVKKWFFAEKTDYRIVRNFLKDLEKPKHETFNSFMRHYSFGKPVKNAFSIHGERDRFDSVEFSKQIAPNLKIGTIKHAGSFCFYEKPEAYNKALLDFIKGLEEFVKSRETGKSRQKNRSLRDFENANDRQTEKSSAHKIIEKDKEKEKAVAKK